MRAITITTRISDELAARLDAEVARLQAQHPAAEVNRSTVVRAALAAYLNQKEICNEKIDPKTGATVLSPVVIR